MAVNICRGAPEGACKDVNTAGTLHTEESKKLDELNLKLRFFVEQNALMFVSS